MLKKWVTITNKKGEEYEVLIVFDDKGKLSYDSSCPCKWGSWHRWSQENRKNKWMCRHIVYAYGEITKQSYERARQTLIKQGLLNKDHIKKR